MLRHYFTLEKIAQEISFLKGCILTECFTQEKNVMLLCLSTKKKDNYLQISTDPRLGGFFYRENHSRAKANTTDLFSGFLDQKLINISLFQNDRIVELKFEKASLLAVLFGGANSNILAVDRDLNITGAFKKESRLINKKTALPKPNLKDFDSFPSETALLKALSQSGFRLGKHYAKEFCLRNNIDCNNKLNDFSVNELEGIKNSAAHFRDKIRISKDAFVYRTENEYLLSLIPLQSYPELHGKYSSVNKAAERKVIETLKNRRFFSLFSGIKSNLEKKKEKLSKNISQMKKSGKHKKRLEKYRLYAELLSGAPNPAFKGASSIVLKDYEGSELEIPLDEKLTLIENSGKYFEKVKKAKEERKVSEKRIPLLENQLKEVNLHLDTLKKIDNLHELEKFQKRNKRNTMQNKGASKFREFDLGEGCILYAGKNAANNDELTIKFAKPNDIWLHARGSGGSHCVLKLPVKNAKPPKHILQKAAETAAYYSQARKSKYTPVAYTEKKYVRKPKGANPGSVTISREKTIMVAPNLPV